MIMNTEELISRYIEGLPELKRSEIKALHQMVLRIMPGSKLWFLDGRNSEGRTVSNPNIGYGSYTVKYANGKTREFYLVGISANKSGISVYIFGISDKTYLPRIYGPGLGKASVSGYCIKFSSLKDINEEILEAAIRDGSGRK
jgi:hypothetical protein